MEMSLCLGINKGAVVAIERPPRQTSCSIIKTGLKCKMLTVLTNVYLTCFIVAIYIRRCHPARKLLKQAFV